jgi:hypothetical protein
MQRTPTMNEQLVQTAIQQYNERFETLPTSRQVGEVFALLRWYIDGITIPHHEIEAFAELPTDEQNNTFHDLAAQTGNDGIIEVVESHNATIRSIENAQAILAALIGRSHLCQHGRHINRQRKGCGLPVERSGRRNCHLARGWTIGP